MHLMRPISLLLTVALFADVTRSQLLSYDGFGNGPRADLDGSNAGSGWTGPWVNLGTDPTAIAGPGLTYPSLATTTGAAVTPPAGGVYPGTFYQRAFPAPAAGSRLYVSCLFRADAGHGQGGGLQFGQYPYAMSVGAPRGMYVYGLMTSRGLGSFTNRPLLQDQTVLLVVRIQRSASGTSIVYDLFLDPVIGSGEPAASAATYAVPGTTLPSALALDNGTGFTTDELRVATSWDAALPAAPSAWTDLGFAKPGVHGAPRLLGTGTLSANSPFGVTLNNGAPSTLALLVLGTQAINAPLLGGVLVPDAALTLPLNTDATGSLTFGAVWPGGIPAGLPLFLQCWLADAAATFGCAASNGLRGVTR